MSEPFLGEIKIVGFDFPPKGWAACDGAALPINQNQALFSILGTTYGGDGRTTFALPDLRGRVPVHVGGNFNLGLAAGEPTHTLSTNEMPQHNHVLQATGADADGDDPTGRLFGKLGASLYGPPGQPTQLDPSTVAPVGGSQAHENMQPFLVVNMVIALSGVFPSRN